MIRPLSILLALGLVASALAGAALHCTPWLRWLDLLCAAAALGVIWRATDGTTAVFLITVALLCVVSGIVGLVLGATKWLAWVSLGHGLGLLGVGILATLARVGGPARAPSDLASRLG